MTGFRVQELEYLRAELNQRLNYSYEHTNKLFGHIILLWGGTLVLLGNANKNEGFDFVTILFIMATIFFISVVVLYLLSQRNDDNLKEISKLASYITIFYEGKLNNISTDKKQDGIFWALTCLNVDKKGMGKLRNRFKNEYFWLSAVATVVIVAVFIIMINPDPNKPSVHLDNNKTLSLLVYCGCIGYILISAFLLILIFGHLSLTWEKWRDREKRDLRLFLKEAIEMNYYANAQKDIKDRYGEKFYNEIVNDSVQKSLDKVS